MIANARRLIFGAMVTVLCGAQHVAAEPQGFQLDPKHSTVAFMVEYVGFLNVQGIFHDVSGMVHFDEQTQDLRGADVRIATHSVDTGLRTRDIYLRSADFFDSGRYPLMLFTLTGTERAGARNGFLTGDLTIRGITRPVTLNVVWNGSGDDPFGDPNHAVGISARGTLRRSEWGMDSGIADFLVGDTVEILIDAELIRTD